VSDKKRPNTVGLRLELVSLVKALTPLSTRPSESSARPKIPSKIELDENIGDSDVATPKTIGKRLRRWPLTSAKSSDISTVTFGAPVPINSYVKSIDLFKGRKVEDISGRYVVCWLDELATEPGDGTHRSEENISTRSRIDR
jgi:hypothetical protein